MAPIRVVKAEALGGLGGVPRVVDVCNRDKGGKKGVRGRVGAQPSCYKWETLAAVNYVCACADIVQGPDGTACN